MSLVEPAAFAVFSERYCRRLASYGYLIGTLDDLQRLDPIALRHVKTICAEADQRSREMLFTKMMAGTTVRTLEVVSEAPTRVANGHNSPTNRATAPWKPLSPVPSDCLQHVAEFLSMFDCARLKSCSWEMYEATAGGPEHLGPADGERHRVTDDAIKAVSTWSNVKSLDISKCRSITSAGFQSLSRMLKLQHLSLANCLQLQNQDLARIAQLPLVSLDVSGCHKLQDNPFTSVPMTIESLVARECGGIEDDDLNELVLRPALTSLDLSESLAVSNRGLQKLSSTPLKVLHLQHCPRVNDAGLQYLVNLPLKELSISSRAITDAVAGHIKRMPLERLDMSLCSAITDTTVRELANMALRSVRLQFCRGVTPSAVRALAARGCLVDTHGCWPDSNQAPSLL